MEEKSVESPQDKKRKCINIEQDQVSKYFKSNRLTKSFFDQDCVDLSKALLGKYLCRNLDGIIMKGKIVETESYLGSNQDGASHSYQGKKTKRNCAMHEPAGSCYVYKIYGVYHCFNITSRGEGSAVLIRALDPVAGIESMRYQRKARRKPGASELKDKDLCNGPSKLCDALNITKDEINFCSLTNNSDLIWLEDNEETIPNIITTKRVGIEGAGQPWCDLPLRFYVAPNKCVSVRDKLAEKQQIFT